MNAQAPKYSAHTYEAAPEEGMYTTAPVEAPDICEQRTILDRREILLQSML